ncbi:MAG: glycosyltransferase family 4 protein [Anaerolineae bacterium]|jgi:glycosyltransferase involved in cell wall biosynthesis
MRIAHLTATFPPHYTGTGVVCYHNALGLARLGHQVTVLTAGEVPAGYADPPQIQVRRLPAWFRLGNAPFTPGLLRLDHFDLVHLHYPFYFGGEFLFARSILAGQPYVVTYHQDVLFQGLLRYPERLHHHLLGCSILARADRVLATSLDYAAASRLGDLMARHPRLVGELPNGVDAARFHPGSDGRSLRARYGLQDGQHVILFVGALDRAHYFKGIDVLLDALARLDAGDVHLFLVGDGDLRPAYQAQARALGLDRRVTFCGRVPAADLPAHYALCDLLALPSTTMGEAFGLVLIEAMATAKPVVASNLPGVRSVVADGADGLLVRPGDAADLAAKLRALLDDPARRMEMGRRGRQKVEAHYDWPVVIPRLARVYDQALAGGRGAGRA